MKEPHTAHGVAKHQSHNTTSKSLCSAYTHCKLSAVSEKRSNLGTRPTGRRRGGNQTAIHGNHAHHHIRSPLPCLVNTFCCQVRGGRVPHAYSRCYCCDQSQQQWAKLGATNSASRITVHADHRVKTNHQRHAGASSVLSTYGEAAMQTGATGVKREQPNGQTWQSCTRPHAVTPPLSGQHVLL